MTAAAEIERHRCIVHLQVLVSRSMVKPGLLFFSALCCLPGSISLFFLFQANAESVERGNTGHLSFFG